MTMTEYETSKLIIKSFSKEYGEGWGKSLTTILNENLLSFVTFDGDDLFNIVFDKNVNELYGDADLIEESMIKPLKVKLASILDEQKRVWLWSLMFLLKSMQIF